MAYFTINNAGSIGVIKDIQDHDLPIEAWSGGDNVRITGYQVEPVGGHLPAYNITVSSGTTITQSPAITAWWMISVNTGEDVFWIYAGQNKVYAATNDKNHINITRQSATSTASITTTSGDGDYSATSNVRWNGAVLSGVPIINNSIDPPQKWSAVSSGTRLEELDWDTSAGTKWSDVNVTAKVIRAYREFGIALDTTESGTRFPRRVRWSTPAVSGSVPVTWDETDTTRDAGFFDLDDTGDIVIDSLPLRDLNYIYKENTTWSQQFIGGQFVHAFRKMFNTVGALSRDCVKEFFGKHIVLTPSDLVVHDGINVESIIDKKWKRFLFNDIDTTYFLNTYLVRDHQHYEIWICYPEQGAAVPWPTKALVWNWRNNTWGIRSLDNFSFIADGIVEVVNGGTEGDSFLGSWSGIGTTWGTETGIWNFEAVNPSVVSLLAAKGTTTELFSLDVGNTFNGTPIPVSIERLALPILQQDKFGQNKVDITRLKHIRALWPYISAEVGTIISVSIGKQDFFNGNVTYNPSVPFTVGSAVRINTSVTGRLIAVKFESSVTSSWALTGYTLDGDVVGRF